MSERTRHKFTFEAEEIARSARDEADYHRDRLAHWTQRAEQALTRVRETIGAKVVTHAVTGGDEMASIDVDYGDRSAWDEYQLAVVKTRAHRQAADRYETEARIYGTQVERTYELDTDDVDHFRLGGQARDE